MNTLNIFNQRQAAEYLTQNGIRTEPSELSLMGKHGTGPQFQRLGRTKIFTQENLDDWIAEQTQPPPKEEPMRDCDKNAGGLCS